MVLQGSYEMYKVVLEFVPIICLLTQQARLCAFHLILLRMVYIVFYPIGTIFNIGSQFCHGVYAWDMFLQCKQRRVDAQSSACHIVEEFDGQTAGVFKVIVAQVQHYVGVGYQPAELLEWEIRVIVNVYILPVEQMCINILPADNHKRPLYIRHLAGSAVECFHYTVPTFFGCQRTCI